MPARLFLKIKCFLLCCFAKVLVLRWKISEDLIVRAYIYALGGKILHMQKYTTFIEPRKNG